MTRVYLIAFALFMLVTCVMVGAQWLNSLVGVLRARRSGQIRAGLSVGRTVYRSSDPGRFHRVVRWRIVSLAIAPFGLAWLVLLTVGAMRAAASA